MEGFFMAHEMKTKIGERMQLDSYTTTIPGGWHWSFRLRRGMQMQLTDVQGGANVGMVFFNADNLFERLNVADSLKCQHTFYFSKGNCLFSDMGRIFASVIEDSLDGHECICGNSHAEQVSAKWGRRDYQRELNRWRQNGNDAFLTELHKYGLDRRDLPANVNWFSKVEVDEEGHFALAENYSEAGARVILRIEMDTLVVLHTCAHPLSSAAKDPARPVQIALDRAAAVTGDDPCLNHCDENRRGFENNALYHLGV